MPAFDRLMRETFPEQGSTANSEDTHVNLECIQVKRKDIRIKEEDNKQRQDAKERSDDPGRDELGEALLEMICRW